MIETLYLPTIVPLSCWKIILLQGKRFLVMPPQLLSETALGVKKGRSAGELSLDFYPTPPL
ncbi:hypothetical protein CEE39_02525 [bacterium (candidate division B38) B3_B38]|nr:MAG: hypothetical protein CEE39_02525 [bacterium (candidate division B38) B3_B38]